MTPREKRIVTAFIHTIEQKVYTVDQVVLMAEDFHNRHMLTEDALDELYGKLDKMDAEKNSLICYTKPVR